MRALIFFNENLNTKQDFESVKPPLAIYTREEGGRGRLLYCHKIVVKGTLSLEASDSILATGFRTTLVDAKDLHVRAWAECNFEDIEILK